MGQLSICFSLDSQTNTEQIYCKLKKKGLREGLKTLICEYDIYNTI